MCEVNIRAVERHFIFVERNGIQYHDVYLDVSYPSVKMNPSRRRIFVKEAEVAINFWPGTKLTSSSCTRAEMSVYNPCAY
jgi:hypothetical protein